MGLDIDGWVEVRWGSGGWTAVIEVGGLLFKHADLFGCLCGVSNYAHFEPLFADRGFPPDSAGTMATDAAALGPIEGETWIAWSDLKLVDWTEKARERDDRVTEFCVGPDGKRRWETKWSFKPGFEDVRDALFSNPEAEVVIGDRIYSRVVMRREEALEGTEFKLLMALMERLAQRFGDDGVRLVVYFA